MAFEPHGERARWQVLYEELASLNFGDLLTYERMADLLDLPLDQRHSMQLAMRRAAKELAVENARHIQAVRGVGYEIVDLAGQVKMTKRGKRKADRAMVVAQRPIVYVDQAALAEAPATIREAFIKVGQVMDALAYAHRRAELRTDRIERTLDLVREEQEGDRVRTQEEIDLMKTRLARLEAQSA